MDNKEDNILVGTETTLRGLSMMFRSIRKMPDDDKLTDAEREQMREAIKNSDLDKAEASLKESIQRIANLAKPK